MSVFSLLRTIFISLMQGNLLQNLLTLVKVLFSLDSLMALVIEEFQKISRYFIILVWYLFIKYLFPFCCVNDIFFPLMFICVWGFFCVKLIFCCFWSLSFSHSCSSSDISMQQTEQYTSIGKSRTLIDIDLCVSVCYITKEKSCLLSFCTDIP